MTDPTDTDTEEELTPTDRAALELAIEGHAQGKPGTPRTDRRLPVVATVDQTVDRSSDVRRKLCAVESLASPAVANPALPYRQHCHRPR